MSRIEHEGRVASVEGDVVRVEVEAGDACSACAARRQCAMGHAADRKIIEVATANARQFGVGERVVVASSGSVGAMALVLGYVAPLVVLLATLVISLCAGAGEQIAAVASISAIAVYYAVLYGLRRTISRKVNFIISKTE